MRLNKPKFYILIIIGIAILFLSSDLGIIDIEKTAIVTGMAIDLEADGEYSVSMQIAVPEATDTNNEKQKTLISGKGKTVSSAIAHIADTSGWYPKLSFCNIFIVGKELAGTNTVKVVNFLTKSLLMQDSAILVLSDTTAKELLDSASPLDQISSFALQKVILKNPNFDRDVIPVDIKTFCTGYYSDSASSMIPLVKIIPTEEKSNSESSSASTILSSGSASSSSGSSSSGNSSSKCVYDASSTALFKNGKLVGTLDQDQTYVFNLLTVSSNESNLRIYDVSDGITTTDYLLTVMRNSHSIKLKPYNDKLDLIINLNLFCRVNDDDSAESDLSSEKIAPLPSALIQKAQNDLTTIINQLVEKEIQTGCDMFKITEKLYRYHNQQYSLYKNNFLSKLNVKINVTVSGQK